MFEEIVPEATDFMKGFDYCFRHTNDRLSLQEKLIEELRKENIFLRNKLNRLLGEELNSNELRRYFRED